MKQERLITLDIIKALAIILVVIGHYIPDNAPMWYVEIRNIIYTFHMPLFLFASGYIYQTYRRNTPISDFYRKKFNRLIIPYISASIVIISIKILTESFLTVENPVEIYSFFRLFYLPEAGYFLWYIWTLVTIFLIVPFINTFTKQLIFFSVTFCVAHLPFEWTDIFSFRQTILMSQYFALGMIIAEQAPLRQKISNIPIMLLIILFVSCYLSRNSSICIFKYICNTVLPFVGIGIMCQISLFIKNHVSRTLSPLIFLSSCSYIIYLFHTTFEGLAKAVFFKLSTSANDSMFFIISALVVISCGIIGPVILQKKIIEKNKILRFLFGLK